MMLLVMLMAFNMCATEHKVPKYLRSKRPAAVCIMTDREIDEYKLMSRRAHLTPAAQITEPRFIYEVIRVLANYRICYDVHHQPVIRRRDDLMG